MNKIIIIGNLTRDPELRYTPGDNRSVCSFDVAVNGRRNRSGQQEVSYFRVTAWDKRAESCAQYLTKGSKVCVTGPVSAKAWQSERDGSLHADLYITATEVEFLYSKSDNGQQQTFATSSPSGFTEVETDELPF